MVTTLAWSLSALFAAVAVVLGVLVWHQQRRQRPRPLDRLTYEVVVKLYGIRQRLNVHQYKSEVRREGARARRALQAELRRWEDWGGE